MKTRILSGLVGAAMTVVILFCYDTIVLNFAVAIISTIAVFELLIATKYVNNKLLALSAICFSFSVPFFRMPYLNLASKTACLLFVGLLFAIMLIKNGDIKLEQLGLTFLISIVVPFGFSSILYIRDYYGVNGGLFFIVVIFVSAWATDIAAYFTGSLIGKHKLAPTISPKKTVEGAVGGIIGCIFITLVWGIIYDSMYTSIKIDYLLLAVMSAMLSVIAMFGDLSCSLIKRTCNIKDFGNIMPGHGGILDRFDSVLFVAPTVYIVLSSFPEMIIK